MSVIPGKYRNKTLEVIIGTEGDDFIYPGGGWDFIDGRGGIDTVYVEGRRPSFQIVVEGDFVYIDTVSAASPYADRVQLVNIELVQFTNARVDLFEAQVFSDATASGPIFGLLGEDSMRYSQPIENYSIERDGGYITATRKDQGTPDKLYSIDRLVFPDQIMAFYFTPESLLGQASRLLTALLGADFIKDAQLSGLVISALENGLSIDQLAAIGASSDLVSQLAGSNSDDDYVRLVYRNVVGQEPDADTLLGFVQMLQSGSQTKASLAVLAAQTIDLVGSVDLADLSSSGWAYSI